MNAVSTALFILIILSGLPQQSEGQHNPGAEKYFRHVLQKVRTEFNVPALGGVLVMNGKVVVAGAYGERKQGDGIQVTDNDRFPIGSISKTFTAFLAARLTKPNNYILGMLTWDTKVIDVFPQLANTAGIYPAYLNKTIGDFTTHQSGLPNDSVDESSSCDRAVFNSYMVCGRNEHMIRSMKRPPEPFVTYSNIGPVMVANMAQQRTGKIWEDLIRQYIFTPLHLSAGFISSLDYNNVTNPLWHLEKKDINIPYPYNENDRYNIAAPSGHIVISPKDMGKYLVELMPGAAGRVGVLTPAILDQYLEPYNSLRTATRGGWFIDDATVVGYWAPGEKVLQHNGSHGFNYSVANLLPDQQLAFCSMSNSSCNPDSCGKSRGIQASEKLNEHFRYMWFNRQVLPFYNEVAPFTISLTSKSGSIPSSTVSMKDMNMLSTWKSPTSSSTLLLTPGAPLAAIKALVLIYPRRQQAIKSISIYAVQGSNHQLLYTESVAGQHHSIFEFEPALASHQLSVRLESLPNKVAEIAEVLLVFNDPLNNMTKQLRQIKVTDKKVIQPPPVLQFKKNQ